MRSIVVPLLNFNTKDARIDVDPRFVIRHATSDELTRWRESDDVKLIIRRSEVPSACAVVEGFAEETIDSEDIGDQTFNEDIYALISLLQLRANRLIWCPFAEIRYHSLLGVQLRITEMLLTRRHPNALLGTITLNHVDSTDLQEYWAKVTASERNSRKLRIALGRWALAKSRMLVEDALIDAWIGLESLFTDHSVRITIQASSRIAQFLAEGWDKRQTFGLIKEAYDQRSQLVHGEIVDPATLNSTTEWILQLLWMCLNKLLTIDLSSFDGKKLQAEYFRTAS